MLASLRWALERHRGEERKVVWPRLRVKSSREEAYAKVLQAGAFFQQNAAAAVRAGETYALQANTGEKYTGRVEFVRELRGFCLSVRELNDALFWVTIEGASEKIEVQIWLSAFNLPQATIMKFEKEWSAQLQKIFA